MITPKDYDNSVDIWSAGCIFAEMLLGRPLFPGVHEINQLHLILDNVGKGICTITNEILIPGFKVCYLCVSSHKIVNFIPMIELEESDWNHVMQWLPNKLLKNHPLQTRTPLRERMPDVHPLGNARLHTYFSFDAYFCMKGDQSLTIKCNMFLQR